VTDDLLSLQSAARVLDLPRLRLFRLGHYLRYASSDPCLRRDVVDLARSEPDAEVRYRLVLHSLLADLQRREAPVSS
jgi:hypothetical protein